MRIINSALVPEHLPHRCVSDCDFKETLVDMRDVVQADDGSEMTVITTVPLSKNDNRQHFVASDFSFKSVMAANALDQLKPMPTVQFTQTDLVDRLENGTQSIGKIINDGLLKVKEIKTKVESSNNK